MLPVYNASKDVDDSKGKSLDRDVTSLTSQLDDRDCRFVLGWIELRAGFGGIDLMLKRVFHDCVGR
jgi:hypothetical protein